MMSNKRKQYSSNFKAKVALEAVQNEATVAEIAQKYGVHPTMVNNWKRALLDGASDIFDKGQKSQKQNEAKVDELYRQIGQLKVERDFLSKKSGL